MSDISIYNLEHDALDRIPLVHLKSHRIRGNFKTGKKRYKTETVIQDVVGIMPLRDYLCIVYIGGSTISIPNNMFTSVSIRVNK